MVPMAPLSNISTTQANNGVSFGVHTVDDPDDIELFVNPPTKPALVSSDPATLPEGANLVAYWWIGTTNEQQMANMATRGADLGFNHRACGGKCSSY